MASVPVCQFFTVLLLASPAVGLPPGAEIVNGDVIEQKQEGFWDGVTPGQDPPKHGGPVFKVITLLKDMLKQMEKEGEEDEEIYDKMACWCETNDNEKTKAIADAEAKIKDLTAKIEEGIGSSARLNTEVKNLKKDIEKDQQALDQADALRQKELAEFNDEEKDSIEAISALKNAIIVLSKHHTALQQKDLLATLQYQMDKHVDLLSGVLTKKQQKVVSAFVQGQGSASYAPQSGEIFGILKQMKETFESNLAGSQKEEAESVKSFEELKASKEAEIAAATEQIDKKSTELAD